MGPAVPLWIMMWACLAALCVIVAVVWLRRRRGEGRGFEVGRVESEERKDA